MSDPVRETLLKRYRQFCAMFIVVMLACTALMFVMRSPANTGSLFKYAIAALLVLGAAGALAARCPACKKFALNIKNRRIFCKACKAEADL